VTIEDVSWRGACGVSLRGYDIEVVVLPQRGGKIASLRQRATGREWLEQPEGELRDPPDYGSPFAEAEMFGWDEMLPTIVSSSYPDGEYRGTRLPDHGELWALPWEVRAEGETLVCSTAGRALPYQLTRAMSVERSRLYLEYELSVTGRSSLWLLWAAHPQFAVELATRVVLPTEVRQLLDVWPSPEPAAVSWPSPDIESTAGLAAGAGRKLYALPDAKIGTAALVDADGAWLQLEWDPTIVPYLGIWLDNGAFARHPVIALEPTNGFYDDLAQAAKDHRVPQVHPGSPLRWSIEVRLGVGPLP
jgi:galactose mutarotase-like enzyme